MQKAAPFAGHSQHPYSAQTLSASYCFNDSRWSGVAFFQQAAQTYCFFLGWWHSLHSRRTHSTPGSGAAMALPASLLRQAIGFARTAKGRNAARGYMPGPRRVSKHTHALLKHRRICTGCAAAMRMTCIAANICKSLPCTGIDLRLHLHRAKRPSLLRCSACICPCRARISSTRCASKCRRTSFSRRQLMALF